MSTIRIARTVPTRSRQTAKTNILITTMKNALNAKNAIAVPEKDAIVAVTRANVT